jgi:hypothetical protein
MEVQSPEPAVVEPAAVEPHRRPRRATALIFASAALLGVVAGVATGYTIQAKRPPTPLPPLSQASLSYPEKYLPEGEHEPGEHDRALKTDGDLRKLLVKKPKGARALEGADLSPDGWVSLISYTRGYDHPGGMFTEFTSGNIRRIAGTEWHVGEHRTVVVRLIQYYDTGRMEARYHAEGQQGYISGAKYAASDGRSLKGSGNGKYWVDRAPTREPGYRPLYRNRAIAWRGDIVMSVDVYDHTPVSATDIRELAEKQWGRL